MNFDDFDRPLDPDAEALAYKLQAYLKSKSGNLLEPVTLTHKKKQVLLVYFSKKLYFSQWRQ